MIRWITSRLGTSAYGADTLPEGVTCVDVRLLADRSGNAEEALRKYIDVALLALQRSGVVVICCDHGISRSNTIAAAVLSRSEGIALSDAVRMVMSATHHAELNLGLLETIQSIFPEHARRGSAKERWLITGGNGYLGRALRASAPPGVEVISPSRTEMDLAVGGVELSLAVREEQVQGIVHLASPHVGNTNSSLGTYLAMLRNVLEVCANYRIRVLIPSRWEVFAGYTGKEFLADESFERQPATLMGDRYFLAEELVEQFSIRHELQATILRTALVYGGGGGPNFLRGFLKSASNSDRITTHWSLNGEPRLDMLHVNDWVSAMWGAQQAGIRGLYHCGSGGLVGTKEIAKLIAESVGRQVTVETLSLNTQVAKVGLVSQRLTAAIGWEPRIPIDTGLRDWTKESMARIGQRDHD